MALILNIESSTEVCSVSLARNGKILDTVENLMGQNHSRLLTVYIEEVFQKTNLTMSDLEAVAVSGGPGSYTGLRIGVAAAKGICYALNKPLISITSLASMADHVTANSQYYNLPEGNLLFCPMIDARRMEVYTALFDRNGKMIRAIQADIIDSESFKDYFSGSRIAFFGNGADKCKSVITDHNAIFVENIRTSAAFMAKLAQEAFEKKEFQDVAYYEPFYLKDFVATIPTKNVFGNK
jgi:tRNA threonylcarbamoyladenosine biosynthesis protein TsaB